MARTRYWRVETRAEAEVLYREAARIRDEERRESDLVVRERLRQARFILTDRAVELERKAVA